MNITINVLNHVLKEAKFLIIIIINFYVKKYVTNIIIILTILALKQFQKDFF